MTSSSVTNKIIERKYVKTKSTFFIEGQGATGTEGLGRGPTNHERLRTTELDYVVDFDIDKCG